MSTLLKSAATLALLSTLPSAPAAATLSPSRPNIVFILADDLGYGHLGNDPREQHDLAATQPARAAAFRKILASARTEPPPQIEPARPPGMDYR